MNRPTGTGPKRAVFAANRTLLAAAVWAALAAAARADGPFAPQFAGRAAFDRFVQQGWDSPFGLDYVFIHNAGARNRELVDSVCRDVPVRWVNFAKVEWRVIERKPPVAGRHSYNWFDLDEAVRAWQRNGAHPVVSMRVGSSWATAEKNDSQFVYLRGLARTAALATADYVPKPEHWDDFRHYVQSLVERYDGDGRDDMPGLLFPVLHYQVGNEFYNEVYWTGSADEYGKLLREAAAAARAASSDVKIILSGIGFEEVYGFYGVDMDVRTRAYVRYKQPQVPAGMRPFVRRSEEFSFRSAEFGDAYDILDARWPNYGIVAASKELLRRAGFPDKPVWSAEIYSSFPLIEKLVLPNWTLQAWPTPSRSVEYSRILKRKGDPQFDEVNAWYRGLQAAHVVKLSMVALDAGSEKLMMGWAVDFQNPLAVSSLSHHGLYSGTFKRLWPAGYTYGLLIRKLEGLEGVRRLDMPENVYVYECTLDGGRRVLVAFYDDHIGQNHDQPTGETRARITVDAPRAQVTHVITEIGQTEPQVDRLETEHGTLRIKLTEYPVFIEPNGRGR